MAAAFFSLGTGSSAAGTTRATATGNTGTAASEDDHQRQQQHHRNGGSTAPQISPESWFLYRNVEDATTFKGFELWQQQEPQQQQQQDHHHNMHHHQQQQQQEASSNPIHDLYASAVGLGIGPSRTSFDAAASSAHDDRQLSRSSAGFAVMMRPAAGGAGAGIGGAGISCQDCGNQAKKDCSHMRCRTCCKSRGFHCATHVKSTWVPAAKRRERQHQLTALQQQQQIRGEPNKRQKNDNNSNSHISASNNSSSQQLLCTRLSTLAPGMEVGDFPSEVSSQTVFRCVRVSSMEDGKDQYAYQTSVSIGGHVFKGILLDQGPDGSYTAGGGESSSGTGGAPPPLNLIPYSSAAAAAASSSAAAVVAAPSAAAAVASSSMAFLDPASLYQTTLSSYLVAGTQFLPSPRP